MTEIEQKLLDAISSLTTKGKANGVITYKEITDALGDVELEPEQIEKIYEALEHEGVEVVADMEKELEKIEEELEDIKPSEDMDVAAEVMEISSAEGVSIDDHVKMYLKEIGKVPLLDAEEEMILAKQMSESVLLKQTSDSLYLSLKDTLVVVCCSWTLYRKEILGLSKQLKNLITPRDTSSVPTQHGGFVSLSHVPSLTRQEQSVFLFIWLKPSTSLSAYLVSWFRNLVVTPIQTKSQKSLICQLIKFVKL